MSTTFKEEAILVLLASCSALIEMLMSSLEISSSSFFPCDTASSCLSAAVFQNKLAPRREWEIYPFKESHYYLLRPFGILKLGVISLRSHFFTILKVIEGLEQLKVAKTPFES